MDDISDEESTVFSTSCISRTRIKSIKALRLDYNSSQRESFLKRTISHLSSTKSIRRRPRSQISGTSISSVSSNEECPEEVCPEEESLDCTIPAIQQKAYPIEEDLPQRELSLTRRLMHEKFKFISWTSSATAASQIGF